MVISFSVRIFERIKIGFLVRINETDKLFEKLVEGVSSSWFLGGFVFAKVYLWQHWCILLSLSLFRCVAAGYVLFCFTF